MTEQGPWEFKIEIAALSSEVDKINLKKWSLKEGRSKVPTFKFDLTRTSDSITIDVNDDVTFWRREIGEVVWGDAWFRGYVRRINMSDKSNIVTLNCWGLLGRLKARTIYSVAWGNTHVVDKEYGLEWNSTGSRSFNQIYADLDSGLAAQTPLESVRLLSMFEYVNSAAENGTYNVNRDGINDRELAQYMVARGGILRKIWVKGFKITGTTTDLIVEIQADDGSGSPDGTNITTFTVPFADFPSGSGSEDWVEIDLLRNVSDPTALDLQFGQRFWVIFRMDAELGGDGYTFRMAKKDGAPRTRWVKTQLNAGGWEISPTFKGGMFYGTDFADEWGLVDSRAYFVQGEVDPPRVFFKKWTDEGIDIGQFSKFTGEDVPKLFTGQKLVRVSYWKGTITYATVVQRWAQSVASDLYDTLTISITEPTTKQFVIKIENADGLKAFDIMRQYAPITVRMYEDSAGLVVMEITDELEPDTATWNLYNATEKAKRTFKSGFVTSTETEVRIMAMKLFKEIFKEVDTNILIGGDGKVLGCGGDGSLVKSGSAFLGGFGGSFINGQGFSNDIWNKTKSIRQGGSVTIAGFDQSVADGPFRHANELITVRNDRLGITSDTIYAVQTLRYNNSDGQMTTLAITFVDTIFDKFIPATSPGGPTVDGGNLGDGGNEIFVSLKEGAFGIGGKSDGRTVLFGENNMSGGTDAPTTSSRAPKGAGQQPVIIRHFDASFTIDISKQYWINIGTGSPGATSLGAQVAQVAAFFAIVDTNRAEIVAYVNPPDLDLDTVWPVIITEVGLAESTGIGGAKTDVKAWDLGEPELTFDIFNPQPELTPDIQLAVCLRVFKTP